MQDKPYVVLVGMDFSGFAARALSHAFEEASRRERSAVHVLSVIPGPDLEHDPGSAGDWLTSEAGVRDGVLASLCARVQEGLDSFICRSPLGTPAPEHVESHVRFDAPTWGLLQLATEIAADLIVLGTRGQHGLGRLTVGSVTETVVRLARCPVLVVPLEKDATARRTARPEARFSVPPRSALQRPTVRPVTRAAG